MGDTPLEFSPEEKQLRDNYVGLHEAGESYESIARRLEVNVNDYNTAAKVRALAAGDGKQARKAAPRKRTAPSRSTAAVTGDDEKTETPPPAKKATPAKAAAAKKD